MTLLCEISAFDHCTDRANPKKSKVKSNMLCRDMLCGDITYLFSTEPGLASWVTVTNIAIPNMISKAVKQSMRTAID
jgi:hypothetical protein